MAQASVICILLLIVHFITISAQILDQNAECSYGNNTMSVSISIKTKIPIELQLYFTNPLTLRNETIQYNKKESSSYTTYTNNSFFTAKRGPLKSAHMKYIPVYQQTAERTDLVTTVDFCLLNTEAVSAEDISEIIGIVLGVISGILLCGVGLRILQYVCPSFCESFLAVVSRSPTTRVTTTAGTGNNNTDNNNNTNTTANNNNGGTKVI